MPFRNVGSSCGGFRRLIEAARVACVVFVLGACGGTTATDPDPAPPPPPAGSPNPAPEIESLSVTDVEAGRSDLALEIRGSGFVVGTTGTFRGLPRETAVQSTSVLVVTITESDLREGGHFEIRVFSPGPGGGTSNALTLRVTHPLPLITGLPASGGSAGLGGFVLMVHGEGFVPGSTASWSGAPRETNWLSARRLGVALTDTDVASAGSGVVRVESPPPGGGTSGEVTLTLRQVRSSAGTVVRRVVLEGVDLAYDEASASLYVTRSASAVVRVDPRAGQIVSSATVGARPGRVAVSDDGAFLYVGVDDLNGIRQMSLPALAAESFWPLPEGQTAADIDVFPGLSTTVAVVAGDILIFDDGVPRSETASGFPLANRLAIGDRTDRVYGHDNVTSDHGFYTYEVDAAGIRQFHEETGLITRAYGDVVAANGRVYANDGSVIDVALQQELANVGPARMITVDDRTGRIYTLYDDRVEVHDVHSLQPLGQIPMTGIDFPHPATNYKSLVRWGSSGLAFLDEDELFLVESPIIRN